MLITILFLKVDLVMTTLDPGKKLSILKLLHSEEVTKPEVTFLKLKPKSKYTVTVAPVITNNTDKNVSDIFPKVLDVWTYPTTFAVPKIPKLGKTTSKTAYVTLYGIEGAEAIIESHWVSKHDVFV